MQVKISPHRNKNCPILSYFGPVEITLKGHSRLCDCADLDASFSNFEKSLPQPEIKVHLEIRSIFRSVLLDFQSFTEESVLRVLLLIL